MKLTNPWFMKKIIDKNRKQRAIFTLEVSLGRSKMMVFQETLLVRH